MSVTDALQEQAATGTAVVVIEPPSGLSDSQRALVEKAIQLMASGNLAGGQALLDEAGFSFTVQRVQAGELVEIK